MGKYTLAGARKLEAFIERQNSSVRAFCAFHKLDRIQVQRLINGERGKRVSVDFAKSVEKATKRAIKWTDWLSRTVRWSSS